MLGITACWASALAPDLLSSSRRVFSRDSLDTSSGRAVTVLQLRSMRSRLMQPPIDAGMTDRLFEAASSCWRAVNLPNASGNDSMRLWLMSRSFRQLQSISPSGSCFNLQCTPHLSNFYLSDHSAFRSFSTFHSRTSEILNGCNGISRQNRIEQGSHGLPSYALAMCRALQRFRCNRKIPCRSEDND